MKRGQITNITLQITKEQTTDPKIVAPEVTAQSQHIGP